MDLLNSWLFFLVLSFSIFFSFAFVWSAFSFRVLTIGKCIMYTHIAHAHLNDNVKILVWNQIIHNIIKECFDEILLSLAENRIFKRKTKWDQRQKEMGRKELNLFFPFFVVITFVESSLNEQRAWMRWLPCGIENKNESTKNNMRAKHTMPLALFKHFYWSDGTKKNWFNDAKRKKNQPICAVHVCGTDAKKTLMIILWYILMIAKHQFRNDQCKAQPIRFFPLGSKGNFTKRRKKNGKS